VVICDERGRTVDGDQIMAIIAGAWADAGRLTGGGVVATVMSNLGLERFMAARGLKLERAAVGDRYVMEKMRAGGFNLGGEQSGHVIMSDISTTGDGLIAALQVLAVLAETDQPMSALARQFEPAPQLLRNIRIAGGKKPLETERVQSAIAEAEASLKDRGRIVVRASGTEPLIRIMAEGDDETRVAEAVAAIAEAVEGAKA
jgi:phosphoglucosamine mutase